MNSLRRSFCVADLTVQGEVQLKQEYEYEFLEQIPGAAELIGHFSGHLYRCPDAFDGPVPGPASGMQFRWWSSAPTAGIATLRHDDQLTSVSLLASGLSADADDITLNAFQQRLLRELHDSGYEPAFGLLELKERPLVATINFHSPTERSAQAVAALADRCFAASYFRYHRLV